MIQAGQALANKELWLDACAELSSHGISFPSFIPHAVRSGKINVFNRNWTNNNPSNVIFRGRRYASIDQLLRAKLSNGVSVYQNLSSLKTEIQRLLRLGAIRSITPVEAHVKGSVINPIQFFEKLKSDGTKKVRLIVHSKMNATFTKPQLKMPLIAKELNLIAKEDEIIKVDQSDRTVRRILTWWRNKTLISGFLAGRS